VFTISVTLINSFIVPNRVFKLSLPFGFCTLLYEKYLFLPISRYLFYLSLNMSCREISSSTKTVNSVGRFPLFEVLVN
jgi:hypothetical protein